MNEPTAAGVSFQFQTRLDGETNVLVFDLGGGCFDVSILTVEEGIFEVKSTSGDTHLGGRDFVLRAADFLSERILKEHRREINEKEPAFYRLQRAFEPTMRILSSAKQAEFVADDLLQDFDFKSSITRARFVVLPFYL